MHRHERRIQTSAQRDRHPSAGWRGPRGRPGAADDPDAAGNLGHEHLDARAADGGQLPVLAERVPGGRDRPAAPADRPLPALRPTVAISTPKTLITGSATDTPDTYESKITFDCAKNGETVPPPRPGGPAFSIGENTGFSAYHFEAESTGRSQRGARAVNIQDFYLVRQEGGCPGSRAVRARRCRDRFSLE